MSSKLSAYVAKYLSIFAIRIFMLFNQSEFSFHRTTFVFATELQAVVIGDHLLHCSIPCRRVGEGDIARWTLFRVQFVEAKVASVVPRVAHEDLSSGMKAAFAAFQILFNWKRINL